MKRQASEPAEPRDEPVQDGDRTSISGRPAFPIKLQALPRLAPTGLIMPGTQILVLFGLSDRNFKIIYIKTVHFRRMCRPCLGSPWWR
jgi:hypothetical protein